MKPKFKLLTSLISILLFIFILITVKTKGIFFTLDNTISSFMPILHNNFLISVAKIIGLIFGPLGMTLISILTVTLIFVKISKKDASFFTILMLLQLGIFVLIKNIIQRARPLNKIVQESTFSFPSGHSIASMVFFGILIYLTIIYIKSKNLKLSLISLFSFMIILIGFSRIYLNVHWFSDILAGFLLGLFILLVSIIVLERFIFS